VIKINLFDAYKYIKNIYLTLLPSELRGSKFIDSHLHRVYKKNYNTVYIAITLANNV